MSGFFLSSLVEEVSQESIDTGHLVGIPGYDELEVINYSIESVSEEIQRGVGVYEAISDLVKEAESETSMESVESFEHKLDCVLMASGLNIPKEIFYSVEAVDKSGKPSEAEASEDKTDKEAPKEEKDKDPKDKDEKKDEKLNLGKAKDALKKVLSWLLKKSEEFTKWIHERVKKLRELSKRVLSEADSNEEALKGA